MSEIDFQTALARLLRDTAARDDFAQDAAALAARWGVRTADREAFARLAPEEIEAQARVLVRKRFREAQRHLPETCARLGPRAWPHFLDHARAGWPADAAADALAFGGWLRERDERVEVREWNRLRFTDGRGRLAVHFVRGRRRCALPEIQVLFRRADRVAEWSLRIGW